MTSELTYTFLNIVNQKNMRLRLLSRKKLNRYDNFNSKFYTNVQKGFLLLAKKNPHKYMKIDSNLDIKNNKKIIISKIDKLI